jgi:hypothetical protein
VARQALESSPGWDDDRSGTFAEVQLRQPGVAESMVIHEILHTLGLGESPQPGAPTSIEITQRVEARCR